MKIKDFAQYQKAIEQFCIYPNEGKFGLMYPILGFIDEMGEFLADPSPDELGDAYFYPARILSHVGLTYPSEYRIEHREKAFDLMISDMDCVMEISQEKFPVACGQLKKFLRDDNQDKLHDFMDSMLEIVDMLHAAAYWQVENKTMEGAAIVIMQMNYDKLYDRMQRNVIKGDGDYR
jgi:hypothetical protein